MHNPLFLMKPTFKRHFSLRHAVPCIALLLLFCATAPGMAFSWRLFKRKARTAVVETAPIDTMQQMRFNHLYYEAMARVMQNKHDEAFELLRRATEVDSTHAPSYYTLSDMAYVMGDSKKAIELVERAIRLDSTNLYYNVSASTICRQAGQVDKAIEWMERATKINPEMVDLYYNLGELYQSVDSINDCLRVLNKIEELEGVNVRTTLYRYYLLKQQGKMDEAFAAVYKLKERYPYSAEYRLIIGNTLMEALRLDEAKKNYDEAAKLEPNNAQVWLALAEYANVMGMSEEADSLVQKALLHPSLEPEKKVDILRRRIQVMTRNSTTERPLEKDTALVKQTEELFEAVIRMHPSTADLHYWKGMFLQAVFKDEEALQQLKYAVEMDPSVEDHWGYYITQMYRLKMYDELLETSKEGRQYHPKSMYLYTAAAFVYQNREEYRKAIELYQEALQHFAYDHPTSAELWGNIGDLHHEMREQKECYEAYEKALELDPKNISVLNNYSYFLALEKRHLEKAERMASKVIQLKPEEPTYLDTYAWVFFRQGNYLLAKFYLQTAISKMGKEIPALYYEHYADVLYMMGDEEQAMIYWLKAAEAADGTTTSTLEEKIDTGKYVDEPIDWEIMEE